MKPHEAIYTCPSCWEETQVSVYPAVPGRTDCHFEDCIKPELATAEPSTCPHCDEDIPQSFIDDEFD